MNEYERIFTKAVWEKIKEKIRGRVDVFIDNNIMYVRVRNEFDYTYGYMDISTKVLNGLTSDYVAYDFCKEYRKYINVRFFK